jgi:hypothetical protein
LPKLFLVDNCRCDKDADGRITGEEVKEVCMLAILNPFFTSIVFSSLGSFSLWND